MAFADLVAETLVVQIRSLAMAYSQAGGKVQGEGWEERILQLCTLVMVYSNKVQAVNALGRMEGKRGPFS